MRKHKTVVKAKRVVTEKRYLWWAYLHESGRVIVERWFGDPREYNACAASSIVQRVVGPFEARDKDQAIVSAKKLLLSKYDWSVS